MDALAIAAKVFAQPWVWFSQLLESTGMDGVFLAVLSMYLAFKFLVAPLFGSRGDASSDTADKRRKR